MILAVIWCLMLGACVLTHTFVCKVSNCNNYAQNIRCHCTKLSRPSNQMPEKIATLIYLLPTAASLNKTLKHINNYKYQDFRIK